MAQINRRCPGLNLVCGEEAFGSDVCQRGRRTRYEKAAAQKRRGGAVSRGGPGGGAATPAARAGAGAGAAAGAAAGGGVRAAAGGGARLSFLFPDLFALLEYLELVALLCRGRDRDSRERGRRWSR
jgi:hypothetical protein